MSAPDRETIETIAGKAHAAATGLMTEARVFANNGRALMAEFKFAAAEAMTDFGLELQRIADRMPGGAFDRSNGQ